MILEQHSILVTKWGINLSVNAVTAPEDLIGEGGLQYWADTEEILDLSSSDATDTLGGTGMQAVLVEGVNRNFYPIWETVGLNGLTIVNTKQKFYRVNRCFGVSGGSDKINNGLVTLHNGVGVMAAILAGRGQTTKGTYTVPDGYTNLAVTAIWASLADSKNAHAAGGAIYTMTEGSNIWRQRQVFSFTERSPAASTEGFEVFSGDDIRMEIDNADVNGLAILGGFTVHIHKN